MTDHDHTELTDERLARITARVHAGITASSPGRNRSLMLLRAAIVLLVVASAALAGWAYDTNRGGSPDGPASSPTAPGPEGLALVAAEQPVVAIGDGYAHLVERRRDVAAVVVAETWIAADGTGRTERTPLAADGSPGQTATTAYDEAGTLLMSQLTPDQAAALGDDPDVVFAALVEAYGADGAEPSSLGPFIVDLLAWPGVPPATRAALFRILGDIGFQPAPSSDPGVAILVGRGFPASILTDGTTTDHETVLTATFDAETSALVRSRQQAPDEPTLDTTVNILEASVTATPY